MWKASFDRSLDEVGREEGKRDCNIGLADAAAVSRGDALGICPRVRDELVESAYYGFATVWSRYLLRRSV